MPIETKNIGELKGMRFYVPAYQRGYRWTEHEVTALLDDIDEFSTEGNKAYCIQPLILKKRGDNYYEVVDGQQRLTTIYIFMKIAEQEIRSATSPFDLEYETRKDSAEFLQLLSDTKELEKEKNIDYYHIVSAYEAINIWLEKQKDKSVAIQKLNTKIRESVFFIWYEILSDDDPISMFTKVNLGKIPLTNAELIKALMLSSDNFDSKTDINERQTEISLAWDRVEQGLRDDSFWYFINEQESSGTRIDMLFLLLASEYNAKLPLSAQIPPKQNYFSFLVFSAALVESEDKELFVKRLWGEIDKLYAELRDWYSDLNKFHVIGYLIASGVNISDIVALTRGKRKSSVMKDLLSLAKKITGSYDLSSISYGDKKIRKLLLLFNIATLVCKSEKQYRFPFDIYKGETGDKLKWDIEHIHATADESDEVDDSLWNLTLLERGINRNPVYAAKPFSDKRTIIIDRESKGLFVPLCTKNIFLKVYTEKITDMDIWGSEDKTDYIADMKQTLNFFFEGRFA